ncbi:MAG: hypothetical protein JKX81_09605 [Arenicella sp.]|nr:hypothetical protein [Arenicella sp.]
MTYRSLPFLPFFFVSTVSAFDYSGSIEASLAYSNSIDALEKTELIYKPRVEFQLSDNSDVTIVGRVRADFEDIYEPGEPKDANRSSASGRGFIGDDVEIEVLEAFIDMQLGNTWLRLGKQKIVWGQADAIKVLDVLNPQSFREFILDDFNDRRTALWSVNAEMPVGDSTLQIVWIPDTTYFDLPKSGGHFALTSPRFVPTLPQNMSISSVPIDKPNHALNDSDIGLRLFTFKSGWDLTLNYAYHYSDRPVVRRSFGEKSIEISQKYERTHLVGGSFSNAFGAFAVRGELGYSTNRYFLLNDNSDADGVYSSSEFSTVFGVDYTGISCWLISGEIYQSTLTDYNDASIRDKTDSTITASIRRNLRNETLALKASYLRSINNNDGLLRLSANYGYSSEIEMNVGLDIFHGDKSGVFGQFANHDRITLSTTVSF